MKRFLVALVLLICITGVATIAYAAYTIIHVTSEVMVDEAISVSPGSFTASMYPAETITQTLTLSNAGSVGIEVNFTWSVDPIDPELAVKVPAKVTVPALGNTTADIDVSASKSAVPGLYTISIGVTR